MLPDRSEYRTQLTTVDHDILDEDSPFQQEYSTWDPDLAGEHPGSPVDRIWQLFGSRVNSHNLVNFERNLNGIKATVWAGNDPMSNQRWRDNRYDDTGTTQADFDRAEAALSYLNSVSLVIPFTTQISPFGLPIQIINVSQGHQS